MPKRRSLPLSKVYGLLETGPVVLVTTAHKGRSNIMTQSWHTMMEFEPPLIGCVISARNYSFDLLDASRQCVFNIPTAELLKQVVGIGNCSGKKIDKFKKFGLTPLAAECVQAPLIDECYANLECKVVDRKLVNSYNFFILEVVQAWIVPGLKEPQTLHHRGNGNFMIAGPTVKTTSKMK